MKRVLSMIAALLVGAAVYGQQRPFSVAPTYPTDGGEVTITYNPSATGLADSKSVTGVIYLCVGNEWRADDLLLTPADGALTARYTIPAGTLLFGCKFYGDDGKWDSGSDMLGSYGMFVYDMSDTGKPIRKQYTWMQRSILFSRSLDRFAIPGFLRDDLKEDDKKTLDIIKQELLSFPASANDMFYYTYLLLAATDTEGTFHNELRTDIGILKGHGATSEINLLHCAELSRNILRDEALVGEINAVILKRFPDGILARGNAINEIFNHKDKDERFAMLEKFVDRFPPADFPAPHTMPDEVYYPRLYWSVLRDMPQRYDPAVLGKYLPMMTYSDVVETFYRGIHLPFTKHVMTAAELKAASAMIYKEFVKRTEGSEDLYVSRTRKARYSPSQWHEATMGRDGEVILTHAKILQQSGDARRALEILEPLRPYMGSRNSGFNDTYAALLAQNGHDNVPFIESSVREGAATPEMVETLRKAYKGGDFDAYMDGLRSKEHAAKMAETLTAQMVKEPIDPWRMEDTVGGVVDMKKLKGKVIVLDFWASWCVPCMAAMPGMKMAADRYADNPDVAFYFVNTMERAKNGEHKKYVPEMLAKRGFPEFKILYDSGNFAGLGSKFTMYGIPQKAIIDRAGNVRWISGGYNGNPLELANEIGFIVDTLLAE